MLGVTFEDKAVPVKEKKAKKKKEKKEKDKKKAKKEKKEKKGKEKKAASESASGSASDSATQSSGEDEGRNAAPAVQREEWMTKPMASSLLAGKREDAEAKAAAAAAEEEKRKKEEEPVYGLRIMKPADQGVGSAAAPGAGQGAAAQRGRPPMVGDGGLSWRMKALQRSKEQAKESGQSLQDVVAERWGSLGELSNTLASGTAAKAKAHIHHAKDRVRAMGGKITPYGGGPAAADGDAEEGKERDGKAAAAAAGPRSSYIAEMKVEQPKMRLPSTSESLSWRRRSEPGGDGGRDRSSRGREERGREDRDREHGGDREERERERSGDRERLRDSERVARERDGSDWSRGRDRDRDIRAAEDGRRGDRDRDRDGNERRWGRDFGGGSVGGGMRGRERGGPRMTAEQKEALQGIAGEFNSFQDDGSFMERVRKQQGLMRQQAQGADVEMAEAEVSSGSEEQADQDQGNKTAADALHARLGSGGRAGPRGSPAAYSDEDEGGAGGGAPSAPAVPEGNKSAAELLRARLKGLPVPTPSQAPAPQPRSARSEGDRRGSRGREEGGDGRGEEGDGATRKRKEVVMLPMVDAQGKAVRGAFGREANVSTAAALPPGQRPPKRTQRYDESGQKTRYFADDDAVDLDTLVKRTKYGDDMDADLDRTVTNNIMRKQSFKANELNVDDEYEHDAGVELYESRQRKGTVEQAAAREKSRQVAQAQKAQKLEDQCMYCKSNPRRPVHLTVSASPSCYLMLPPRGRLVPGHCCLVPSDHLPSIRQVDDHVWEEIKNFMKCLIRMYEAQGKHCIFFETAMNLRNHKRHAVLECVPVGQREMDKAPGFFKKAMQEAESEWSQHHAKAVIDTNAKKGLHASIPPNFPYTYVQFGYGTGYVHVIDDESQFDAQFARQVLVGLLRLPPEEMHRRHKMESTATQQQFVREFVSTWAPYDWTLQL